MKIVFRMALYIMQSLQQQLLVGDLEAIMDAFQSLPHKPDFFNADRIISAALKVKLSTRQLDQLSTQYDTQQATQKLAKAKT